MQDFKKPKDIITALKDKGYNITEISLILESNINTVRGWYYYNKNCTIYHLELLNKRAKEKLL